MKAFLCVVTSLFLTVNGWSFAYLLNDQSGLPFKWPAGLTPPGKIAITIMLGDSKTLTDGNNYNSSAKAAADVWNGVLGDNQFVATLVSSGTPADGNGINELAFADNVFGMAFGSGVLAVTTTDATGNQRTEADTLFNTAWTWDSYRGAAPSSKVIDLRRVAIHELGHNLGLDHPDDHGQMVTAIMNSHIGVLDTVAADDVTGVQNLYGPPGVPANDDFANAIAITLDNNDTAMVTGFNTNATKQTGEPNHAGNIGGNSVWWKWTAPSGGSMTIDTKGSYSDTTLAVYTGTSVSSLTLIASNDDLQIPTQSDPTHIQASKVTFTPVPGTTYYIAVDGFNNNDGFGADSSGLTVNLVFAATGGSVPVITAQPVNQTVTAGNIASFSVTATSTGTITYQWYFNNIAVSGATGNIFNIGNAQAANAGSYSVTVTNNIGPATSSTATLTVNPAPVPPPKSGGGGGGGAPSLWFCAALSLLGLGRRFFRSRS